AMLNIKILKSYGGNLICNGGFDDYSEVVSPSKKVNNLVHTWDNTLNGIPGKINKAYNAINWGTGFNGNVALPELGYHAHMRIIDNNKVFRFKTNEDYVNKTESDISGGSVKPGTITVGRWLGIAEIIDGSKLKAGETYMLTVDVYRVSGNNIVTGGLYYATTSSNGSLSFGAGKCSLSPSKAGAWESLSWTFTLGNDYSYAKANPKLYIYGNAGGAGELYVDNIKLEQVIISNKEYDTSYTNNDLASIDKLGYTFSGWYNNSSFDNILTNTTKFDNNSAMFDNIDNDGSNARIYARFVPNNYIVKYNANGGTGTMENTTCTYDKNCVLSTNTFTRKGYSFNGWSDNANGTKIYDDKANVNNLVSSGTKNLYAVWKPNTLTITYNANGGTDTKKTKAIPFSAVYKYDGTNFASGGLPNANGSATSGTWALTKPGYTITADWLVGSSTSSKVISANSNYATVQALATAIGYPIELKNQTVTLYAKWKSSLKIDKSNVILGKGKTIQLSAVNDVGESVTWTSSNTKVATVSKGLVTGVSRGIVTI
ncbi:MAG: InlB B-repeat-containing protein, partial [Romboutsia sp.]|nr:InlB B-repeat-containing protein [Romboutsia sp.]